ncbi:MAG: hypothetical protein MZW92_54290 [Comamonadaceae bacterium]|nr:hypothetical protein [Comamonadaceae bacterium]
MTLAQAMRRDAALAGTAAGDADLARRRRRGAPGARRRRRCLPRQAGARSTALVERAAPARCRRARRAGRDAGAAGAAARACCWSRTTRSTRRSRAPCSTTLGAARAPGRQRPRGARCAARSESSILC